MSKNETRAQKLAAVLRERFGDPAAAESERIAPGTPSPPPPPRPTGRRRAFVALALVAALANPADCGGGTEPNRYSPRVGTDPTPSNVLTPVTFKVIFQGNRTFRVFPYANGRPLEEAVIVAERNVVNVNGRAVVQYSGLYERTFPIAKGSQVSLEGKPAPNVDGVVTLAGVAECHITSFTGVLRPAGFVRVTSGGVHCGGIVP
jgi:hypothetical protein